VAEDPNDFRLLGPVKRVRAIVRGLGVQMRGYLTENYGGRNWRKMKGVATVEDEYGWIGEAEVHWFEAHGVGRVKWKIKRRLHRS